MVNLLMIAQATAQLSVVMDTVLAPMNILALVLLIVGMEICRILMSVVMEHVMDQKRVLIVQTIVEVLQMLVEFVEAMIQAVLTVMALLTVGLHMMSAEFAVAMELVVRLCTILGRF